MRWMTSPPATATRAAPTATSRLPGPAEPPRAFCTARSEASGVAGVPLIVSGVLPCSSPQVNATSYSVSGVASEPTVTVADCPGPSSLVRATSCTIAAAEAVACVAQPVARRVTVPPGATVAGVTLKPKDVTRPPNSPGAVTASPWGPGSAVPAGPAGLSGVAGPAGGVPSWMVAGPGGAASTERTGGTGGSASAGRTAGAGGP